ncbi:tetratricopeptide repeat protein [Tenacibaculum sp. C7A-26P2]|uniref:tetratricopeptide repeat protein n=1 Tax=Tenacibaculum sp. C7A-26P2 TaxID=3447504 RepID=UPI003F84AA6F
MSDTCVNHIEEHWKALTTESNNFFKKGNYKKAISGYKDALYRAEVLNNNISDCIRLKTAFVQIYIISCNNLANTFEKLNNKKETEKLLKRVIYYLLHLKTNKDLNIDSLQSELKRATLAYIYFRKKNNLVKKEDEKLFTEIKKQLIENNVINIP